ncbi:MAG: glycerol kinase GlpK [Deltaproteobacteria bacterium]|nr:glycerol kinase GlpK [Deltaproteobacteria bacterium]
MTSQQGVVLAIDQGTTGSTALVIAHDLQVLARVNAEFPQIYPQPGWVEHDPEDIWRSVGDTVRRALAMADVDASAVRAVGITNQRETSLFWDRATGAPIHNAIVWQCRRTADVCQRLRDEGHLERVRRATGLVLDPYFSATKAAWTLDHVPGARARAERGELAFGTIDSFLLWRLTGGAVHVTDVTNASRTSLLDIRRVAWDPGLLELFDVPAAVLPEVRSSSEIYGHTRGLDFLPDGVPIAGIAGDQQAALFGQACYGAGDAKCTYGTGAFVLMNTGAAVPTSEHGLLSTIAWRLGDAETIYALEGSVFIAGAAVQWLRDALEVISTAPDVEALARSVPDSGGIVVVPAFAGLGAPYWDADARGAVLGLTRGSGRGQLARATLDSIAQQVADVVEAMSADAGRQLTGLRVDGGAAANDLLMQMQADLLGSEVVRSAVLETTGLGAAFLAGIGTGFWSGPDEVAARWRSDASFEPQVEAAERQARRSRWKAAVDRIRGPIG